MLAHDSNTMPSDRSQAPNKWSFFSLKSRETQQWGKACTVPFLILSPRPRAVGLFTEQNACKTRTVCTRKVMKFLDLTFQLDFRGVAKATTRHSDRVAQIQKAFVFFFFFPFFPIAMKKGYQKASSRYGFTYCYKSSSGKRRKWVKTKDFSFNPLLSWLTQCL